MRLNKREKVKNKAELPYKSNSMESSIQPVIFSGIEPTKGVFYFDDDFEEDNIMRLICNIEQFRQAGYLGLDLYFKSDGGDITYLFTLADYINNLPDDFDLNIIVNGMVASAGFYILLMVDNANITIMKSAQGMIHMAGTYISSYALYNESKPISHDCQTFYMESIKKLNEFIVESYLSKIKISDIDLKHIKEGNDLFFTSEELEEIIYEYKDTTFIKSPDFDSYIGDLESKLSMLQNSLNESLNKYKDVTGNDYYDKFEIEK